ncbi:hypothetical protein EAF04_006635 [Stromatinia cepivora]|nr:hypothetical protein EAF04_006635 [Stromatinia cepivora]
MASRNSDFSERSLILGDRNYFEDRQDYRSERNLFDLRTPGSSHTVRGVHSWPWHPPLAADQPVSTTTTLDPQQRTRCSSPEYQPASPNIWERSPSLAGFPSPEAQHLDKEDREIYTPYPEQPQGVEPHIRNEILEVLQSMNGTKNTSLNAKSPSRKRLSDDEEDYLPPSKRQANGSYQRYDVAASQQSRFSVIAARLSPAEIARLDKAHAPQMEASSERRFAQLKSVSRLDEDAKAQISSASPNGYKNDLYNTSPPPPPPPPPPRVPASAESVRNKRQFPWESIMTPAVAGDDAESQKQPPQNSLFGQSSALPIERGHMYNHSRGGLFDFAPSIFGPDSGLLMEPRHIHSPSRLNLFDIRSPSIFSRDPVFPIGGRGISVDLNVVENHISGPPNMSSSTHPPYRVEGSVGNKDVHSIFNNPASDLQEEDFANCSDTDSVTLTEEAPVPSIEGSADNDSDSSNGLEGYLSNLNDRDVDEPLNIVEHMNDMNEQVAGMQNVIRENRESITVLKIQASDQTQQIASLLETVGLLRAQAQNQADKASRLREEHALRNVKLVDVVIRLSEQVDHHEKQLTGLGWERVSGVEHGASVNKDEVAGLKDEVARLKNEVLKLERDALKREVEELRKSTA